MERPWIGSASQHLPCSPPWLPIHSQPTSCLRMRHNTTGRMEAATVHMEQFVSLTLTIARHIYTLPLRALEDRHNEDDELEAHGWYILLESQMVRIMIGELKVGKGIEILLAYYFVVYQGRLTVSACVPDDNRMWSEGFAKDPNSGCLGDFDKKNCRTGSWPGRKLALRQHSVASWSIKLLGNIRDANDWDGRTQSIQNVQSVRAV